MKCRNPYIGKGGAAHGCGQCMPCRVNKRRVWAHRIMLEAKCHDTNSFWTFTYNEENLPRTSHGLPTLVQKHFTDFLKRLRKEFSPNKLRYFYVGEYGDTTERPHYHAALFGFPACSRGLTQKNARGFCCEHCATVERIWGLGTVYSGQLEDDSAAYIAGYTTKKLTSQDDPRLAPDRYSPRTGDLRERHEGWKAPEFARMSLKPGIGAHFMPEVASVLLTHNLDSTLTDVPTALRHGSRVQPLGRYLTRQLRQQIGRSPDAPPETIQAQKEKLQPLSETAKATAPRGLYSTFYKALIIETYEGAAARLDATQKIYKKRGSI